jgi:diguanylate cyclase (GGDEF)-like protein
VDTLRTDPTTGLEVLTDASLGALRRGSTLAYVDLVHFRDRVNAPFGHVVGDRVLAEVGRRLAEGLTPRRVFRSGGDEFTVEIAGPLDREGAERIADLVALLLARPFEETGEGLEATVGVCLRAVGDDPRPVWAAALRGADTEAPRRGLRLWVVVDPE